jgi:hypothetical protein
MAALALAITAFSCTDHAPATQARPTPTTMMERLRVLAREPLALSPATPASSCPISRGRQLDTHAFGGFALGSGPAFPIIAEPRDDEAGIYHYENDRPADEGWWSLKTLWALSPEAEPPFLVRVARLDGPGGVAVAAEGSEEPGTEVARLGNGDVLTSAVVHDVSANVDEVDHWANYPGATYVREPGCYAFRVDGANFGYTIVFAARP